MTGAFPGMLVKLPEVPATGAVGVSTAGVFGSSGAAGPVIAVGVEGEEKSSVVGS